MKKFLQFISFVFIAIVFSVVAVSAQSAHKFKGEIPFDFSVGENTYPAGTYNVRISRQGTALGLMTLADSTGKVLERVVVNQNFDVSNDESLFTFVRHGNQRFLSKISSADAGFSIPGASGNHKRLIAAAKPAKAGAAVSPGL